jgi:hypothetical protein
LFNLGTQQQQIEQNRQMFPLDVAAKQAGLLRGYTIPTSTVNTYQGSPLSAVAALGATTAGMFTKNDQGVTPFGQFVDAFGNAYDDIQNIFK